MYQHEIGICLLAENLLVEYHFIEVLSLLVLAGRNCKSLFNDKSTGIMTALNFKYYTRTTHDAIEFEMQKDLHLASSHHPAAGSSVTAGGLKSQQHQGVMSRKAMKMFSNPESTVMSCL